MKVRMLMAGLLSASIAVFALRADEKNEKPDEKKPASFWMKKKLEYSEKVLEGLAEADFELIEANAKKMTALGTIEVFVRGRDEEYGHEYRVFERSARELIRAAQDQNIDRASLAYVGLTLSCVNCHKHLRDLETKEAAE